MNKYEIMMDSLVKTGECKTKVHGGSMLPKIQSGSLLTFRKQEEYQVDDIVFCKVKGRYIDAHLVYQKSDRGYLIGNNHNHQNGWTKTIYGKVVSAEIHGGIKFFN